MFELFSKYSGTEPDVIREELISYIYDNKADVANAVKNCVPPDLNLSGWTLKINHRTNPRDETALYLLCKLYHRHAVIVTKSRLWTTLKTSPMDDELSIRAKCDICLILVGKGNTGYGEITRVMPNRTTKTTNKQKDCSAASNINLQQAMQDELQSKKELVPKKKWATMSLSSLNILPVSGRPHNTRESNGTRVRHSSRKLRKTYVDKNYKDMDIKKEACSPTQKKSNSAALRLRTPSYPRRHSQVIITRNRLQKLTNPDPDMKARLIGTVIKEENAVKEETIVNTRRKNPSWPSDAQLVHLDQTPCSEECIRNNHYDKQPDFSDDQLTTDTNPKITTVTTDTQDVTPNNPDSEAKKSSPAIPKSPTTQSQKESPATMNNEVTSASDNSIIKNQTDLSLGDTTELVTPTNLSVETYEPMPAMTMITGATTPQFQVEPPVTTSKTVKNNHKESSNETSQSKTINTIQIDLPKMDDAHDEVTLPELDIENILLNEQDNTALIDINAAPILDFAKQMADEEGVNRDLELELENLTFIKNQTIVQGKEGANVASKKAPNTEQPKKNAAQKKVKITPKVKPNNNSPSNSPKGIWKTTHHGIKKNYGPLHPQNYGCKVCGKLLPSCGELNEHHRRSQCVKRALALQMFEIGTFTRTISTNNTYATYVMKGSLSRVNLPPTRSSIEYWSRGYVLEKDAARTSREKVT